MHIKIDRQDDVCVLRVKGSILPGTASDYLRRKQDEIVKRNCDKVLADFREVPSIGSTGLAFILTVFENCAGRFVLGAPQRLVRQALDLTRLTAVVPMAADLASGLAALRKV
jgi:anti-anti-sigma factor